MRVLFTILISFVTIGASAQVFVRPEGGVNRVKWITPKLVHTEGVVLMRSSDGGNTFQKLSDKPIYPGEHIINYDNVRDVDATKKLADAFLSPSFVMPEDKIAQLAIYTSIIPNSEIAKYIGIEYTDASISNSNSYVYKVESAISGEVLGVSAPSSINGDLGAGPVDVVSFSKNKSVMLGWKNESGRYYGVNIYRTNVATNQEEKLNDLPVLYSEGEKRKGRSFQYVDDTVEPDAVYNYRLVAVDFFGEEAGATVAAELGAKDIIPPPAPHRISLAPDHKPKIMGVSWEADIADDHAGFIVLVSESDTNGFREVKRVLGDSLYTELQLSSVGRYLIAVQAFDNSGNASYAKYDVGYIEDKDPPAVPSGLSIQVDSSRVQLNWADVRDPDLDGYVLYRKKSKNSDILRITSKAQKQAEYSDDFPTHFVSDISYYVAARDTNGNISEMSEPVMVSFSDKNPPAVPQLQKIDFANNAITIEWLTREAIDLKGFNVYRHTSEDTTWKRINLIELADFATRYTDQNLQEGVKYYYSVTAYDTAGNESEYSNAKYIKTPSRDGIPTITAFNSSVQKRSQKVTLNWEVDNAESVIGYMVYHEDELTGKMLPISGRLDQTSFEHKPENPGANTYQVKVFDNKGKKHLSERKTLSIKPTE